MRSPKQVKDSGFKVVQETTVQTIVDLFKRFECEKESNLIFLKHVKSIELLWIRDEKINKKENIFSMSIVNETIEISKSRKLMADSIMSNISIANGKFDLKVRFQVGEDSHESNFIIANRFGGPQTNQIIKSQPQSKYVFISFFP